jgi:hypothetical protein
VRFIETVLSCACAMALAACESPGPSAARATVAGSGDVAGSGAQPATVAGTSIAAARSSTRARDWAEYKVRAALRIQQASAGETFNGALPDPLQSIPVLQVHLNRDGSIRDISVLRTPKQSPETLQMAIRAIRRAAPFEPVGHLPRPWQFNETFLYNEDFKFQLRTLVEAAP